LRILSANVDAVPGSGGRPARLNPAQAQAKCRIPHALNGLGDGSDPGQTEGCRGHSLALEICLGAPGHDPFTPVAGVYLGHWGSICLLHSVGNRAETLG